MKKLVTTNTEKVIAIRDSICKGCLIYMDIETHGVYCNIPPKKNGHPCPCSTCLVKSICDDVCDVVEAYKGTRIKSAKKKKPRAIISDSL